MSLAEAIDHTQWIDTHEHLVEERRRVGPEPYTFTGVWGDQICIPDRWTALLAHYAIDDLISAGLEAAAAHRLIWNPGEPLEKWDAVEAALTTARNTGFLRAVDLATDRLFGRRLAADTCEEIDAACRALRAPGFIPLVHAHPRTTFVLMHAGWPQQEQLLSVAKHFPNVVVDLCWAWSLAPRSTTDFVQRFLTTVPASKLLCFGGDSMVVETVVGHAELARRGIEAALEGLVGDDWLTLDGALALVPQLMRGNALRVFG